ncbi:hypothetical protein ACFODO_18185 [Acinetobacter sichuanensis]|uniref:Uncharacterized protein n=1 Tax=Acinetobacter sichuanensis TaxID=2136183 RepID=A0A371YJ50_9GAMM|nr:hypothetical protein [Acinetobacter sichuanensis]RFC81491.1 hypothetical protein C9E89_021565 [Acinetobacter sichuanensis]
MEILITGFNFIKDNFFWVLMILGVLVWIFPETFLSKIFPKKENPNKAPMDYVAKDSATGKKRILKLAITLYGLVIANRNNKLDFELLGVKNPSVLSFLEAFKNVEEENVRVSSIRFIQNLSNKQLDILSQEFSIVNKTFNGLHIDPRVQMYTFSELMNSMEKFKIFHKSSDDSSMFDDGLFHDLSIYKYNPHDVEKFNDFKVSNSLDLFDHPINGLGSLNGSDLMNHHDSHRGFDSFND